MEVAREIWDFRLLNMMTAEEAALFYRIQGIIEAERSRIERLRDTGDQSILLARGRLEAWIAVSNTLAGITDGLIFYEKDELHE